MANNIYGPQREKNLSLGSAIKADPETFVREGLTLTFFPVNEGVGSKYHYKPVIIDPPAKRHLNVISLACQ